MKYQNQQQLAEQILDALNVNKESEGYLIMLNGKYGYHEMTEENQARLIDEVIAESNVDWFDDEQKEGTIEVNGKQLPFSYA